MLVLLPPSETKRVGGSGGPLDLAALPFPTLTPVRSSLIDAVRALAADPAATAAALKVSAGLGVEMAALNRTVLDSPTLPALDRYTGVLFSALTDGGFTKAERARADQRLWITSALLGQVTATTPVPAYRLSAGSVLPGLGTVPSTWKPVLTPALQGAEGPVVDLRSGSYAAFAPLPDAIQVRVVTVMPDGRKLTVSHDNKHTKGLLARLLATSRAEPADVPALLRLLRRAGWAVERTGDRSVEIPLVRT